MQKLILSVFFILIFSAPVFAGEIFESTERQVSLLELFSSEGCSSCPPAEEWVNGLSEAPGLWEKFIPVVYHVDYWDSLGWKDPFSSARYTARQKEYAAAWNESTIYTPGMVLNGVDWSEWRRSRAVPGSSGTAGVLKLESLGQDHFRLTFQPAQSGAQKWNVHAALLGFGIKSKVLRGENSGLTLEHEFTVLDYMAIEAQGSPVSAELVLREPGLPKEIQPIRKGVAAWITVENESSPVQAVGGYLE